MPMTATDSMDGIKYTERKKLLPFSFPASR